MSIITEAEYRYNMLIKQFPSQSEPAFHALEQQLQVWGNIWGCDNDVGQIRKVLMHRPGNELNVIDPSKRLEGINAFGEVDKGWYWRGDTIPSLDEMQQQHDRYAEILREEGAEIVYIDKVASGRMKQVYTRDSLIAVKGGAIITRLGAPIRRGEELPVSRTVAALGMPILRTISGTGLLEGGSFAFIRPGLAVLGLSSRVNEEGARQLREVLATQDIELLVIELTGYRLHIDGVFVMVDVDTAFINPTLLPFGFLERLKSLGIRTIEVCHEDDSWVINCLAVRPGRVVMAKGLSDTTAEKFDKAGIVLRFVEYDRVALGGGGLHCSTAPLMRDSL